MNQKLLLIPALLLHALPCWALSKAEVRDIIEAEYPGARITEIDNESWQGQKVYEVDFRHAGQKLEAIISLDGNIVSVEVED